jgi:hypothetical protein
MKLMEVLKRKKVIVLLLNKPNLEALGLKYMILSLNKMQSCFEFEFPETTGYPTGYPMEETDYNDPDVPLFNFEKIVKEKDLKGDYFIGVVSGQIGNKWFWGQKGSFGVVTTVDWKKQFAPPSVLEYVIHCVVSLLMVMSDETGRIQSHHPTRGCCLDYTVLKEEDKIDIGLGYICDECKSRIKQNIGEKYLECFEKMHSMKWLGYVEEKGTVANDLKRYFRIDLNKDTGYSKTRRERMTDGIKDITRQVTVSVLAASIALAIGIIIGRIL